MTEKSELARALKSARSECDYACENGRSWCSVTPMLLDKLIKAASEAESLREKTALQMGVGDGTGNLFVYGDYESIKAAQRGIDEKHELRRENARLREVLKWYGERTNYTTMERKSIGPSTDVFAFPVLNDEGSRARDALNEQKEPELSKNPSGWGHE